LLNRGDEFKEVQVDFNIILKSSSNYWANDPYKLEDYKIRDLWEHKDFNPGSNGITTIKLAPHSVKVFRFLKKA